GLREAKLRFMAHSGRHSPVPHSNCWRTGKSTQRAEVCWFGSEMGRRGVQPFGTRLSYGLLGRLSRLFGSIRLNPRDSALQPVLHILAQLFFCLVGGCNRYPLPIQRNVVTGHVFGAVFLGHEVIQQALVAGMRAGGISVIRAGQRVLKDRSWSPGRAIPISITSLLQEVEFVAQYLEHVAFIFRHNPSNQRRSYTPSILLRLCSLCAPHRCDVAHVRV